MSELPDKPSEMIRLALADLRKCEADPAYGVDMGLCHEPIDGVCYVDLAGAVMAQRLGADKTAEYAPKDFDRETEKKLKALGRLQWGTVGVALDILGVSDEIDPILDEGLDAILDIDIPEHEWDTEGFYEWMAIIADGLEKAGL